MSLINILKSIFTMDSSMDKESLKKEIDKNAEWVIHKEFIALEIVTTGPCVEVDRIIAIAAVKISNGIIANRFFRLVNPGFSISPKLNWLTGISNEQVLLAPGISSVVPELKEFIEGYTLIVNDAAYVSDMLKKCFKLSGLEILNQYQDINEISKNYIKNVRESGYNYTLQQLAAFIGYNRKGNKNPSEDALTIAAIYNKIIEIAEIEHAVT